MCVGVGTVVVDLTGFVVPIGEGLVTLEAAFNGDVDELLY